MDTFFDRRARMIRALVVAVLLWPAASLANSALPIQPMNLNLIGQCAIYLHKLSLRKKDPVSLAMVELHAQILRTHAHLFPQAPIHELGYPVAPTFAADLKNQLHIERDKLTIPQQIELLRRLLDMDEPETFERNPFLRNPLAVYGSTIGFEREPETWLERVANIKVINLRTLLDLTDGGRGWREFHRQLTQEFLQELAGLADVHPEYFADVWYTMSTPLTQFSDDASLAEIAMTFSFDHLKSTVEQKHLALDKVEQAMQAKVKQNQNAMIQLLPTNYVRNWDNVQFILSRLTSQLLELEKDIAWLRELKSRLK